MLDERPKILPRALEVRNAAVVFLVLFLVDLQPTWSRGEFSEYLVCSRVALMLNAGAENVAFRCI